MSSFPNSPRLLKGGIVLIDPQSLAIQRVISLQYNPDSLTRSLQIKGTVAESGNRSEALRLTGPPVESLKLEAEIDATDQMEAGDVVTSQVGIQPQLSALETIVYPASASFVQNKTMAQLGTIEISPMESALTLFIWNKYRIIPVRITEFSITEEAFDVNLNPIRAKISLGMRVLNVDDLGFDHKGASLFMNYQSGKERLARMGKGGALSDLGITGSI